MRIEPQHFVFVLAGVALAIWIGLLAFFHPSFVVAALLLVACAGLTLLGGRSHLRGKRTQTHREVSRPARRRAAHARGRRARRPRDPPSARAHQRAEPRAGEDGVHARRRLEQPRLEHPRCVRPDGGAHDEHRDRRAGARHPRASADRRRPRLRTRRPRRHDPRPPPPAPPGESDHRAGPRDGVAAGIAAARDRRVRRVAGRAARRDAGHAGRTDLSRVRVRARRAGDLLADAASRRSIHERRLAGRRRRVRRDLRLPHRLLGVPRAQPDGRAAQEARAREREIGLAARSSSSTRSSARSATRACSSASSRRDGTA